MPFLTVFTPTYNRAGTLHLNYEALQRQQDKDFVWMIVDDGSTDDTEELVASWIREKKIDIKYYKQENAGKPSATNFSIEHSDSILWVCVDSDDYLMDNAVATIRKEYQKFRENQNCVGIIGPKYNYITKEVVCGKAQKSTRGELPCYLYYWEYVYKYKVQGDKIYIFDLKKLKSYRYPIFKGEKFIGESYLYEQIGLDYKFFITDEVLYCCNYLEGGLTSNYLKLHINSPKGYKLLKEQMMLLPKPFTDQFKGAIMYVAACKLCNDHSIIASSPRKIMTLFAYPLGVLAYNRKYAPLIKQN